MAWFRLALASLLYTVCMVSARVHDSVENGSKRVRRQVATVSACSPSPCLYGGTCTPSGDSDFICSCPPNYTGKMCEVITFGCERNPCKNGAACVNLPTGGFSCDCPDGFFGTTCDLFVAAVVPCPGGSSCFGEACEFGADVCQRGETTTTPSTTTSPCDDALCLNGGTCLQNLGDSVVCSCAPGFYGSTCALNQAPVPCEAEPCAGSGNEDVCSYSRETAFSCTCSQLDTDCSSPSITTTTTPRPVTSQPPGPCDLQPCLNGGTCSVLMDDGMFTCTCMAGFYGTTCALQQSLVVCEADPCTGSNVCSYSGQHDFSCDCPDDYSGADCSVTPPGTNTVLALQALLEDTTLSSKELDYLVAGISTYLDRVLNRDAAAQFARSPEDEIGALGFHPHATTAWQYSDSATKVLHISKLLSGYNVTFTVDLATQSVKMAPDGQKFTEWKITWEARDALGVPVDLDLHALTDAESLIFDPQDPSKSVTLNQRDSRNLANHLKLKLKGHHLDSGMFVDWEEMLTDIYKSTNPDLVSLPGFAVDVLWVEEGLAAATQDEEPLTAPVSVLYYWLVDGEGQELTPADFTSPGQAAVQTALHHYNMQLHTDMVVPMDRAFGVFVAGPVFSQDAPKWRTLLQSYWADNLPDTEEATVVTGPSELYYAEDDTWSVTRLFYFVQLEDGTYLSPHKHGISHPQERELQALVHFTHADGSPVLLADHRSELDHLDLSTSTLLRAKEAFALYVDGIVPRVEFPALQNALQLMYADRLPGPAATVKVVDSVETYSANNRDPLSAVKYFVEKDGKVIDARRFTSLIPTLSELSNWLANVQGPDNRLYTFMARLGDFVERPCLVSVGTVSHMISERDVGMIESALSQAFGDIVKDMSWARLLSTDISIVSQDRLMDTSGRVFYEVAVKLTDGDRVVCYHQAPYFSHRQIVNALTDALNNTNVVSEIQEDKLFEMDIMQDSSLNVLVDFIEDLDKTSLLISAEDKTLFRYKDALHMYFESWLNQQKIQNLNRVLIEAHGQFLGRSDLDVAHYYQEWVYSREMGRRIVRYVYFLMAGSQALDGRYDGLSTDELKGRLQNASGGSKPVFPSLHNDLWPLRHSLVLTLEGAVSLEDARLLEPHLEQIAQAKVHVAMTEEHVPLQSRTSLTGLTLFVLDEGEKLIDLEAERIRMKVDMLHAGSITASVPSVSYPVFRGAALPYSTLYSLNIHGDVSFHLGDQVVNVLHSMWQQRFMGVEVQLIRLERAFGDHGLPLTMLLYGVSIDGVWLEPEKEPENFNERSKKLTAAAIPNLPEIYTAEAGGDSVLGVSHLNAISFVGNIPSDMKNSIQSALNAVVKPYTVEIRARELYSSGDMKEDLSKIYFLLKKLDDIIRPDDRNVQNIFVDIGGKLQSKIPALKIYNGDESFRQRVMILEHPILTSQRQKFEQAVQQAWSQSQPNSTSPVAVAVTSQSPYATTDRSRVVGIVYAVSVGGEMVAPTDIMAQNLKEGGIHMCVSCRASPMNTIYVMDDDVQPSPSQLTLLEEQMLQSWRAANQDIPQSVISVKVMAPKTRSKRQIDNLEITYKDENLKRILHVDYTVSVSGSDPSWLWVSAPAPSQVAVVLRGAGLEAAPGGKEAWRCVYMQLQGLLSARDEVTVASAVTQAYLRVNLGLPSDRINTQVTVHDRIVTDNSHNVTLVEVCVELMDRSVSDLWDPTTELIIGQLAENDLHLSDKPWLDSSKQDPEKEGVAQWVYVASGGGAALLLVCLLIAVGVLVSRHRRQQHRNPPVLTPAPVQRRYDEENYAGHAPAYNHNSFAGRLSPGSGSLAGSVGSKVALCKRYKDGDV